MKKSVNIYFNCDINSKDKIDSFKKSGYDEFYVGIYDAKETMSWLEQIKYANSIGLTCTMIHCSYYEPKLNNFWLENEIGEEICNSYIQQIESCHNYTKNFVVHLNGDYNSIISQIGLNRIRKILEVCEKYNVNLCIENLYSEKEIPFIFENIKHKNLKICLDFGHQHFLTPNFDILKDYNEYISVLHIHDNNGIKDEHKIIGQGNINWQKIAFDLKSRKDLILASEIKSNDIENYKSVIEENLHQLEWLNELVNSEKTIEVNTKIGKIYANYINDNDFCTIQLNTQSEQIGFINFKLNSKNPKSVWLNKIQIKEKYQSNGLANILLELFETYCKDKRYFTIEGKFYPENDHAKPFYEKNGYTIEKEYYDTYIYKDLSTTYLNSTQNKENLEKEL